MSQTPESQPRESEATRRPAREEPGMDPREMPAAGREDTESWWLPLVLAILVTLAALAFVAWHLRPGDEGILSYDGREESTAPAAAEISPPPSPSSPAPPAEEAPPPD